MFAKDLSIHVVAAPYFKGCLSAADLDELNIEIIRNQLYRAYLEDFHNFCQSLGDPTSELMADILAFEADRRTINITVNSIGTQLTKEQRSQLFPTIGRLYPAGNAILARADDIDQVKAVVEQVPEYRDFFQQGARSGGGFSEDDADTPMAAAESLENNFFRVRFLRAPLIAFPFRLTDFLADGSTPEQNSVLAAVPVRCLLCLFQAQRTGQSFVKQILQRAPDAELDELQEIRSITWISECVAQQARDRIND